MMSTPESSMFEGIEMPARESAWTRARQGFEIVDSNVLGRSKERGRTWRW